MGNNNSFVWGGAAGARTSFGADTFNVWSAGGIYLNGVSLLSSDRNKKKDFSFVSAREILDKVVELPIQTWRFKTEEDSISHIGPMAQDFMAAFGYGLDDRYLSTLDMDGVTLAAIQGLYELHREKEAKLELQAEVNTALRWHNAQLHSRNDALEARLDRLEKAILRQWEPGASGTD
ncbi:MAG: tail fiber domain-containing protein [Candidatus Hydrogenedentes bacterium]|nr:tail fiber domain-containing protein [Candidatus Hydrogenedentota bacterium]